jgi:hypothetical protein
MSMDFRKKQKMKQGDLTAAVWKNELNVNMLTNMDILCDEDGNILTPDTVKKL